MGTDEHWIAWGERDPYFAVFTQDKFRRGNLSKSDRDALFEAGRLQVSTMVGALRRHFDSDYQPTRALDFGCGVGRVAIPLAELPSVGQVVAVDISPAMLEETRRNCPATLAGKLQLVQSDDCLSAVLGRFDLVHSCIVLQHIPAGRGLRLFGDLVERVAPGGMGVLQVAYGLSASTARLGRESRVRALLVRCGARWQWLAKRAAHALGLRSNPPDPVMEMNYYPLNEINYQLQSRGIRRYVAEFTDHGGALGATLHFQREPAA